jgi:hypothetical protein
VHVAVYALYLNVELGAASASDEDLWFGTRRAARPVWAGLYSWTTVRGKAPEVHLVRRAAAQAGMRPVLVVPVDPPNDVAVHDRPSHRNCFESHGFF